MKTADAVTHFGSQVALAKALKIKPPSVSEWGEKVPWRRQLQLETLTCGVLRHDPRDIPPELRDIVKKAKHTA